MQNYFVTKGCNSSYAKIFVFENKGHAECALKISTFTKVLGFYAYVWFFFACLIFMLRTANAIQCALIENVENSRSSGVNIHFNKYMLFIWSKKNLNFRNNLYFVTCSTVTAVTYMISSIYYIIYTF